MVTMLDSFIQKILREIWARRLLRPRQRVLLAVSGGADSMALLYLFNFLRVPLHLHVTVAHLDHALRKGARRDAQFVKAQCRALKIPVVTGRVDVRGLAGKK